jgi:hypothetical protein
VGVKRLADEVAELHEAGETGANDGSIIDDFRHIRQL